MSRQLLVLGALALLGCGGRVNLGGNAGPDAEPSVGSAPDEPTPPGGQRVMEIEGDLGIELLAVSDDSVYVGNFDGLSRCDKTDCGATLTPLPNIGTGLDSAQIYAGALGVSHVERQRSWFASYSLPAGASEQKVIAGLPWSTNLLWYQDFVYWVSPDDSNLYRCDLPSCEHLPRKVGRGGDLSEPHADGDMVIWTDGARLYRSADYGAGEPVALLPDERLSEALSPLLPPAEDEGIAVRAIATSGGRIYAALEQGVVRWPTGGGARETVLSSSNVTKLYVFDDELFWIESGSAEFSFLGTAWSCLADDCENSRRELGPALTYGTNVVADANDLYWVERDPGEDCSPCPVNRRIRRVARLVPAEMDDPGL